MMNSNQVAWIEAMVKKIILKNKLPIMAESLTDNQIVFSVTQWDWEEAVNKVYRLVDTNLWLYESEDTHLITFSFEDSQQGIKITGSLNKTDSKFRITFSNMVGINV